VRNYYFPVAVKKGKLINYSEGGKKKRNQVRRKRHTARRGLTIGFLLSNKGGLRGKKESCTFRAK